MKHAKKDLQKISKQLKGSAKMHASQAKKLAHGQSSMFAPMADPLASPSTQPTRPDETRTIR